MRKHYTEAQRAELVELVTTGRATIRGAAARLGVADSTAYYWITRTGQPRVRLAVSRSRQPPDTPRPGPTFARLVRSTEVTSSIAIRLGDVMLEVRAGFDPVLLRSVVAALVEATP
jgi:transposase-like protein